MTITWNSVIQGKPASENGGGYIVKIREFYDILNASPEATIHIEMPDGQFVPAHFHITEVGRVHKDFIDCGGTVRSSTACVLQVWVANDVGHRLTTSKFAGILRVAGALLRSDDLPVEMEYECDTVSQFAVVAAEATPRGLMLQLAAKHTACLAPERCGVPAAGGAQCC
jgi:hypothetical protein